MLLGRRQCDGVGTQQDGWRACTPWPFCITIRIECGEMGSPPNAARKRGRVLRGGPRVGRPELGQHPTQVNSVRRPRRDPGLLHFEWCCVRLDP